MFFGGPGGFNDHLPRGVRQRGKDAAGVKPAGSPVPENLFPVHIPCAQLRRSGQPAIGATHSTSDSEPALGEIQSVTDGTANAIIIGPLNERCIHPTLQDEVFQKEPHLILCKGGDHGGTLTEAAAQSPGHVVFTPTLPGTELPGGSDATLSGVEAKHDFP